MNSNFKNTNSYHKREKPISRKRRTNSNWWTCKTQFVVDSMNWSQRFSFPLENNNKHNKRVNEEYEKMKIGRKGKILKP